MWIGATLICLASFGVRTAKADAPRVPLAPLAPAAPLAAPTHARVVLDYVVPPGEAGCADLEAFAAAIAIRLGYDPVVTDTEASTSRTLRVRFRREQVRPRESLRATIELAAPTKTIEAEKTISSETGSCAELSAAAAFAAAILIDPRAMFPHPVKPRAAGPSGPEAPSPGAWPWYEPPPNLPGPPAPAPPPVTPIRKRVGLTALGCAGCAPSVNLGFAFLIGLSRGAFGLDAGVRADLPAGTADAAGTTVSASLVAGELFPHARVGPLRLGIVGAAGELLGEANGEKQASFWAAAGGRAAFEWTLAPPLFVRVAVDGMVLLSRVSLRVQGGELWSSPPFAGGASVGVGAEF